MASLVGSRYVLFSGRWRRRANPVVDIAVVVVASFEWVRFLDSLLIEWVDSGPNVARGHVNIRCPWCGAADPSHHMGIRLEDGAWGCLRDPDHRGRNPTKLVSTLKGVPWKEAATIVEEGSFPEAVSVSGLREKLVALDHTTTIEPIPVRWPEEVRRFTKNPRALERRFLRYLDDRGFSSKVVINYGLRWALTGKYAGRVLFPIRDRDGILMGWTARAIGRAKVRYKAFPEDGSLQHFLWNEEGAAKGGKLLVVVEGPVDGLTLDVPGRRYGVRVVALLGLTCGPTRLTRLKWLSTSFDRIALVLDRAALGRAVRLQADLSLLGEVARIDLPDGVGDPGKLTPGEAREFVVDLCLKCTHP